MALHILSDPYLICCVNKDLRLIVVKQKRSSQVGKEDVQASKPLPEESTKSPTLQETSKQSTRRRRLITEEDDKMFSCNVDPFSEELVD